MSDRAALAARVAAADAFAKWLDETPDAIARLRSVIRTVGYHIERSAHGADDHYALDGARTLTKALMDAGVFAPFSSPEFPEYERAKAACQREPVAIDELDEAEGSSSP